MKELPFRELKEYRKKFENELHENILSYWMKHSIDNIRGGFHGAVDIQNNPVPEAGRSCVLNARILWTFAEAAIIYEDSDYGKIADRAFAVISNDFADKDNGGYYMEIHPVKGVVDSVKHTYAQAFVIYALCKYYEYKPSEELRERIISFFCLLEEKTRDREGPGYLEGFSKEWEPIPENRMADNNEPKSMNTHLHMLEAYTALYNVLKDERAKDRLRELLNIFIEKIIRSDAHLGVFFDESFTETERSKGICSFGHDIEASWLLIEAAEALEDLLILKKIKNISLAMAEETECSGLDKDGGLFLESYRYGSHIRTNKHWWLQAESLVGFMNAYQLSMDENHWERVKLIWNFIDNNLIDHKNGEWFTKLNRRGVPYTDETADDPSPYYRNDWKIDPWKCPYHNGRAMMQMTKRIDELLNLS